MITDKSIKQIDDSELNEQLDRKMEIMELCVAGSRLDESDDIGLYWIFTEVKDLTKEVQQRLKNK